MHTDLLPAGDRLLVFWSDIMVHEVLPSLSEDADDRRYTFTIWFSSDNPRAIADPTDALYRLRTMHFPRAHEQRPSDEDVART